MLEYKQPRVPDTTRSFEVKMYAELKRKVCKTCKEEKDVSAFRYNRGSADKLRYHCTQCTKDYNKKYWAENRTKYLLGMREAAKSNPKRINYELIRNYGITLEQYEDMHKAQNGKCAICNQTETHSKKKRLCVDHDHSTGRVRGLLCNKHNRILGVLGDSVEELKLAITYLNKFKN